jgi:hypothetical protein
MLQVRKCVFETNSSSIHSFYIKADFVPKKHKELITLEARLSSFGWEFKTLDNVRFLDYIWTAIYFRDDAEKYKKRIEDILSPYKVTVNWRLDMDSSCFVYIDHRELFYPILDELIAKPELLLAAILCKESHFHTGDDQYDSPYVTQGDKIGYVHFVKRN